MHNIIFIRRRFPKHSSSIIAVLFVISCLLLTIGIGLAIAMH